MNRYHRASGTLKSRVEDGIEGHSEDVHVKQSMLDETYNRFTRVDRTNKPVKDCDLRRAFARGRVHARTQVFRKRIWRKTYELHFTFP